MRRLGSVLLPTLLALSSCASAPSDPVFDEVMELLEADEVDHARIRELLDGEHACYGFPKPGNPRQRIGYVIAHDPRGRVPLWVSYHLTREYVDGAAHLGERPWLSPDPDLDPARLPRHADYDGSDFVPVPLVPEEDLRGRSAACEREGYRWGIAVPMRLEFRDGPWRELERQVRAWAREWGELWVITGPVYEYRNPRDPIVVDGQNWIVGAARCSDTLFLPGGIGKMRVAVPTGFFKVVVRKTRDGPDVLAFLLRQDGESPASTNLDALAASVERVEILTGLELFPRGDLGTAGVERAHRR